MTETWNLARATTVDSRPTPVRPSDVSRRGRQEAAAAAARRGGGVDAQARPTGEYMANHPRGPVLAGVTDTAGAGNVHFGINTPTPSPNLHPVLRRRLAALSESRSPTLGGVAPQASAGTHAEVHALNAAMNASGHAAHDEDLSRYMLHNVAIGASRTLQGVPPRCTWCHALTAGVRVVEGDHEDEARPPAAPAKPKPKPKPDDGESKEGQ